MREIVVILCAVAPVSADTVEAEPCAFVRQYEGPAHTIAIPSEIIETTGEDVS